MLSTPACFKGHGTNVKSVVGEKEALRNAQSMPRTTSPKRNRLTQIIKTHADAILSFHSFCGFILGDPTPFRRERQHPSLNRNA